MRVALSEREYMFWAMLDEDEQDKYLDYVLSGDEVVDVSTEEPVTPEERREFQHDLILHEIHQGRLKSEDVWSRTGLDNLEWDRMHFELYAEAWEEALRNRTDKTLTDKYPTDEELEKILEYVDEEYEFYVENLEAEKEMTQYKKDFEEAIKVAGSLMKYFKPKI